MEKDLPQQEIWYEFVGRGVEVVCDDAERIRTIFLHRGDGEALAGINYLLGRRQVLEKFGAPTNSGESVRIAAIGDRGAWDRFKLPGGSLHVQYMAQCDEIEMVTLIRADAVP